MSAVITSIFAIGIGVILILSSDGLNQLFSLVPITNNLPIGLFTIFGIFAIAIGVLFLIYSLLFRAGYKEKREEVKEVYVCQFCQDKFNSQEELNNHIQKNHGGQSNQITSQDTNNSQLDHYGEQI